MATVKITKQAVERNILAQREVEVYRRDLQAFASENAKLMAASAAQVKSESSRRIARQQACNTEKLYEKRINEEQSEKRMQALTLAQDELIINELNNQAKAEERRKREIQRICEESPELRELEKTLKLAYLNRERDVQYRDKLLQEERERERERAIEDQMEYDRIAAIEAESGKAEALREAYKVRKAVLEKQLQEKEEQKAQMLLEKEKEKSMVDEIVRKVAKEDYEEMEAMRKSQRDSANAMREFMRLREQELAEKKAKALRDEEEIRKYNEAMDARSHGLAAKKQAKRDEDDRIFKKIVEEAEAKRREEEEFNSLRDMLWEEELEAKRAADAAQRREHQRKMKDDMMVANSQMLKQKEAMRRVEAEQETKMVALMKAKFARDEEIEKNEERARRIAKERHLALIEKQRADKQEITAAELARENELQRARDEREEFRKKVVAEARKRLLEEHAAKLGGYMPGTAFENKEEFFEFKNRK